MAKAKLCDWEDGQYCFITNSGKRTMVFIDSHGIKYDEAKVEHPIRREVVDEVKKVLDVLKAFNHKARVLLGSYGLKHTVEKLIPGGYVANGEMIMAALEHGLDIYEREKDKGLNCDISVDYSMATMHRRA